MSAFVRGAARSLKSIHLNANIVQFLLPSLDAACDFLNLQLHLFWTDPLHGASPQWQPALTGAGPAAGRQGAGGTQQVALGGIGPPGAPEPNQG
jgi:hypothetical protein